MENYDLTPDEHIAVRNYLSGVNTSTQIAALAVALSRILNVSIDVVLEQTLGFLQEIREKRRQNTLY